MNRISHVAVVGALGLALGTLVAPAPTTAAPPPACTGHDLSASKGRLEGAAGSRYLTVRVTNTSGHACSTMGYTRYRFRDADGPIGYKSGPNVVTDGGGSTPVVIGAGRTVTSTLHWVDPGPTVPSQCHAARATAVRLKIHDVDRYYRIPLQAKVCTTRQYRPDATRLGDA
ncbi:MAG: DUF4232 domain-containing protein [Nocardioides sp.]